MALEKKKLQIIDILNINISPARCMLHIKHLLNDSDIEKKIKNLRNELKNVTDDKKMKEIKEELSKLSKQVIRISGDTSLFMAVICNNFIEEILNNAVNNTIQNNKKVIDVSSLIQNDNIIDRSYYYIYNTLPSFVNYNKEEFEQNKKEKMEKNKRIKEIKKNKADNTNSNEIVSEELNTKTEEQNKNNTFNTYIELFLKTIKKNLLENENTNKIKINSVELREFLSILIIESIQKFTTLTKIIIHQLMGVRTMNSNHIKTIIMLIMKNNECSDEVINKLIDGVNDKINLYYKYIQEEKNNKIKELDDDSKKLLDQKQKEKEKLKKKKEVELAEKKAKEATEKYKKLSAEIKSINKK